MKLSEVNKKCSLRILEIVDANYDSRLADYGFIVGEAIEIVSLSKGMMMVRVLNSLYAINLEMAEIILVEKV